MSDPPFQSEQNKSKPPPQVRQRGKRGQATSKWSTPTPTPTPTPAPPTKLSMQRRRSSTVSTKSIGSTKSSLATNRPAKVKKIPVRFVDQSPAKQRIDQKSHPGRVDQIGRPGHNDAVASRPNVVAPKHQQPTGDENAFDSIIAVDDGCRLIDDPSKKSMSSIVRSISKQSIKKILSFDEKVDQV